MKQQYSIDDIPVRRVLYILGKPRSTTDQKRFIGSRSLEEITESYNRIFPLWKIFGKIIGLQMPKSEVDRILKFLVDEKRVLRELLSFTDRSLKKPEPHYRLNPQEKTDVPEQK